uniref:Uncharacterized protein n=1 Tax=Biomphalaria glabrata TaxID=6526 RepID=A0A2C9LT21_BIOGL
MMAESLLCFPCCIGGQPQPLHSVQSQMSSKGDYNHHISPGHLQLSVIDLPPRQLT